MTEKEAIKEIKRWTGILMNAGSQCVNETAEAQEMAISALEEIQQYREIGTVKECREAVEKQMPKKPDYEGDGYADGHIVYDTWICPCCGKCYEVDYDNYSHCPECGQAIDLEVEDYEETDK